MVNSLKMFGSLFAAVFIFLLASGLLNTLVSARMAVAGFSTTTTGIVLSSFYTGLLAGSFVCHRVIQRIGHIRAFTAFAAITTAAALLHGLYLSPWFWILLRFLSGATAIGLFMVIESWLNECCESHYRGRVFSIYMSLIYLGTGIGQQLLNVGDIQGQELFIIAGILFSICLVPVSITGGIHPGLPKTQSYKFISIFRKTPLGMLGCFAAGLTNSAFFAMMPVFCTAIGLSLHELSWIMSVTVFCGLAAQWIVGSLSDRFDRTMVLFVVVAAITVVSGIMFIKGETSFGELALGMGLFGALMFAVYPLSVARTHDIFGGKDAVAVSAGLLLAYSIGASVSPLLASGVMTLLDSPFGLFAFWGFNSTVLAVFTIYLRNHEKVKRVPVEVLVSFVPMKSISPVIMALDPRPIAEDEDKGRT